MTQVSVELELLAQLVASMARVEAQLGEAHRAVELRMAQLHWAGAAADEHAQAQHRWSVGAREMRESLTALRQLVATARENYAQAVAANAHIWARR